MRISDRLIPLALFTMGLGLVSASGFEGTPTRDGVAPAVGVEVVPRGNVTAPALAPPNVAVPTFAVPNGPVSGNGGVSNAHPVAPATRSLMPPRTVAPNRQLTSGEAFVIGTRALRTGDVKSGVSALEYAAENGHMIAQWKLGRMFADGDQVARDDLRAFGYFQDIVENHSDDTLGAPQSRFVADAYKSLARYFLTGIPNTAVKPNAARARDLYAYAASYFLDADAQYRLGRMLLEGIGGPKDAVQAARWLKLAADKDHLQAQALLGTTLFQGQGIPRQAPRGLMYLTIAHDAAPEDKAIAEQQALALAQSTDDERALALTFLRSWVSGRRD